MASSSKNKKIKPVVKVQLIIYACPSCGNEIEEVKLCPMCSNPMRVVEVKELYGEEAEKILEEIKENQSVNTKPIDEGMEVDDTSVANTDTLYLDDIYADDGDYEKPNTPTNLDDALSILDKEEDEDLLDLPPDLPAL